MPYFDYCDIKNIESTPNEKTKHLSAPPRSGSSCRPPPNGPTSSPPQQWGQKAKQLGQLWKGRSRFGKIFCSPALRAEQTLGWVVEEYTEPCALQTLYTLPGREAELTTMFRELGEAPLRTYREHHHYTTLNDLGRQSAEAIRWVVAGGVEDDVLIVGHHATLQVTAHHLIRHTAVYEFVLDTILPHCGLMQIQIGDTEEDVTVRRVDW